MSTLNGKRPFDWLGEYVRVAGMQSPLTPADFHEAIGLWIVSTLIGRRLVLRMAHDDIYPNIWAMLIAHSSVFAKTTALNIGRRLVREVCSEALLPDISTPEALLDTLSARAQRGYIVDEASGLMSTNERDYMRGNTELLLRLYDCPPDYTRATRSGTSKVSAPYFTLLAASTPALMRRYLRDARLWASGWWPRFAIIAAPEQPLEWKLAERPNGELVALRDQLERMLRRLNFTPAEPGNISIARDAFDLWLMFDRWARYDEMVALNDDTLRAAYGRAPTHALKVATCLAALDWPAVEPVPRIEQQHMTSAIEIATKWLSHAKRALDLAEQGEGDQRGDRIYALAAEAGAEGVTLREVCRRTGWRASEVEIMLTELEAVERVRVEEISVRGGKQIRIYAITEGEREAE